MYHLPVNVIKDQELAPAVLKQLHLVINLQLENKSALLATFLVLPNSPGKKTNKQGGPCQSPLRHMLGIYIAAPGKHDFYLDKYFRVKTKYNQQASRRRHAIRMF